MQNVHLRGVDAEDAIAAIEQRLELEGFELLDGEDEAPPENQPGLRRIAIYEDDDWVGIADDPFAPTKWGEVLSDALEVPVFTLAGECDHVFYSHVFVHENGAEKHASKVPDDVKLGDDGRHRISPRFLKTYFPDAKVDGLVVHELGGEENMKVVGEAVGIPKPLFSIYGDEDDAYAILTFRFTGDAESQPDMGVFESELGDLAKLLGGGGGMGGLDMGSLMKQMTGELMKNMMGEALGFEVSPASGAETGNLGQELNVFRTFTLGGTNSVKGLTITLSGSGLDLFDPPEMTAEKFDGALTAKAEIEGDHRIYRFPDLELNPGAVTVRFVGQPAKMGKGDYVLEGTLADLTAQSEVAVTIEEAFDVPLLPGKVPGGVTRRVEPRYAQSYAGRDYAIGWIAFDAWTPLLVTFGKELAELLGDAFGVDVVRKGNERLRFETLDWAKLEPELERGADVSLSAGDLTRGTRIELVHQPLGPNILSDYIELDETERRPPKVVLVWSIPRKLAPRVSAWSTNALARAGADANVVGAVASAQGQPMYGGAAEFPYEHLARTRVAAYDARWLKEHIRSPGWRVLAPKSAPLTVTEGVTVAEMPYGKLIASSASDPFTYSKGDATAMERAVLGAVGEPEE